MNDQTPENDHVDFDHVRLREALDEIDGDFPLPASGNELIMLEIDPHRAHVCWNIEPSLARPFHPLVLRVYDISSGGSIEQAEQAFDVEVFGLQGRWYLDLWRDDRTFISEIGYRNADGSFKSLATSNEVRTPPASPVGAEVESKHTDPHGQPLHTDWPGDHVVNPPVLEETSVQQDVEKNDVAPVVVEPITILDPEFPVANWPVLPVTEAPEATPAASPSASEKSETSPTSATAAGDAAIAFAEEVMTGEMKEFPSAQSLIQHTTENHEALQAFYDATRQAPDPEAAPAGMGGQSGDEQTQPAASSPAAPQPAALEQIVGLSSLEHVGKDVLLEVNAEIHIYGRAKPNTELTLYGQIVKTRPDGSFSVRRPLPHGAVVLPLLYTQHD